MEDLSVLKLELEDKSLKLNNFDKS